MLTGAFALLIGFVMGIIYTLQMKRGRQEQKPTIPNDHELTERSIMRREQNITFALRHYADDRLLSLLESTPDAERAVQIAFSLKGGFDSTEPLFDWLDAATNLLSGLPHISYVGAGPQAFTIAQFQELDRRAMALADACIFASGAKKREFIEFMRLRSTETPAAATQRIFADGSESIASLLIDELQSSQRNFWIDNTEFDWNDPEEEQERP